MLVGIRPEHFEDARLLDRSMTADGNTFTAQVEMLESMGSDFYAYFRIDGERPTQDALAELAADSGADMGSNQLIARLSPESSVSRGQSADLHFDVSKIALFDQQTGQNLLVN